MIFMTMCKEQKRLKLLMTKRQSHTLSVIKNRKKIFDNAYFLKKDVSLHPKGNQTTDVASMQGNPVRIRDSSCCCDPHYGGLLV